MTGHLSTPPPSDAGQALFDEDRNGMGFVMNASRLWAYDPQLHDDLFALMSHALAGQGISFRRRGILVAACASSLRDSYCSTAWGTKLAGVTSPEFAGAVLRGDDGPLTAEERALVSWARAVACDPNGTTDVSGLREAGFSGRQIFAITAYVALRIAFSTVNDALGVGPDAEYREKAPEPVRAAVDYGRPLDPVT